MAKCRPPGGWAPRALSGKHRAGGEGNKLCSQQSREKREGNSGPLRWAWQNGQGRLQSSPPRQTDPRANTGPCLTGRQEASGGQGWEPTQGPTGDLMADARGPAHAVQSVPAVPGGPQLAKGRLAPVGWEGRGWGEGEEEREEVGVSQEERVEAEREGSGAPTGESR